MTSLTSDDWLLVQPSEVALALDLSQSKALLTNQALLYLQAPIQLSLERLELKGWELIIIKPTTTATSYLPVRYECGR